jgi:hypothetical protein
MPRVERPADGVVSRGSNFVRAHKWVRRGSARRASGRTVSYPTALVAILQPWGQTLRHAVVDAVSTFYENDCVEFASGVPWTLERRAPKLVVIAVP